MTSLKKNLGLLVMLLGSVPLIASAQTSAPREVLEVIEGGNQPPLLPAPDARSTIRETRMPGSRVTEVTVDGPAGQYHINPQSPTSNQAPATNNTVRWNVLNFDTQRTRRAAPEPAAVPAPPPPN